MEEQAAATEPLVHNSEQVVQEQAPEVAVPTIQFRHRDSLHFAPARVKKIMLTDNEVGKIKKETPSLVALCIELFIEQLLHHTTEAAQAGGAKLISSGHLRAAIMNNNKFDFLQDLVSNIPDLPENNEESEPAPKKSRSKKTASADGDAPVMKKSGAKKASTPRKPRKKKSDEGEDMETTESGAVAEESAVTEQAVESAPVVVNVTLSQPSTSAPASVPVDEDDFDA